MKKKEEEQNEEKEFSREENPAFFKLWDLKCIQKWKEEDKDKKDWYDYEIFAKTTRDVEMSVWNGQHEPSVEANCKKHICKAGTRVRVWMVSRFGDVGVTDDMVNPKGYDARGLDADKDLVEYEFILNKK
jgi:hypothetical protein